MQRLHRVSAVLAEDLLRGTNISSKAESGTANVQSTIVHNDNDGIVNATDIPVGDDDTGRLTNLFNAFEDIDLEVPEGMRVITALKSGGMSKAVSTSGEMGVATSLKSDLAVGSQSAQGASDPIMVAERWFDCSHCWKESNEEEVRLTYGKSTKGDFSGEITDAAEDFYAAEQISTVESILAG